MTHWFLNKAPLRKVAFITSFHSIVKTKYQFRFSYYYKTAVAFKTKTVC